MSATYSDVDGSDDPATAIDWQDRVDGWPQIRAYKARVLQLLGDAARVLDVGCGPGGDVVAVGVDRCVGVDRSQAMCRAAGARGATAGLADAHELPFGDASFGGVFADRVLQHVERPVRALAEMSRVLRRGGRLVIADPDQESLVIHVPGVRRELVDRVKAVRRDVGYRNGRLVSSLPSVFATMQLADVTVEPFALSLTDPSDAFGLPGWPASWGTAHGFSAEDVVEWQQGIERAGNEGFLYSLIYFVVSGVRT
ncbi:MAG: methyltransferase domain-containing protein [Acidimicrobiia bacterium]